MKLSISKDVSFPAELATRRSAIFGISGSGKSNTATRCIELLLKAGEQVILIDPKGEGWGLQTSADGKKAAYDIIVFGQPRGDVPDLRVEHAEQVADFAVDSGRSVVLSLLGFNSDQDERKFVTAFFKRLYRRKSQMPVKTRTLVVLEEAHLFVPEQASGASGEMVGAIKRIARQGRSVGLGLMVIDQRPQEVAKSIISQSELLICHQLVHKLDRDALRDWVRAYDDKGQGEKFLESLAGLTPGEAWAWSPAWLHIFVKTKVDRRETYDSGATPDGSTPAAPTAKAKVDLDALRSHLAKVVEDAKASDPKALQAKVAELQRQIANRPAVVAEPRVIEKPVVTDAQVKRVETVVSRLVTEGDRRVKAGEDLAASGRELKETAEMFAAALGKAKAPVATFHRYAAVKPVNRIAPRVSPSPRTATGGQGESIPKGERAVLIAIAQRGDGVRRDELTVLTGYKRSSRDAYIQRLRERGFVETPGDAVVATDAGVNALGSDYEPLPTGDALREHWLSRLPEGERKILEVLIQEFPSPVNRDALIDATGYKRSSRDAYLQRLSSRRLVEMVGRGEVRASETLFDLVMA